MLYVVVFFQAEDGIRDLVRSRGLGDVYKRQVPDSVLDLADAIELIDLTPEELRKRLSEGKVYTPCLLYTSDAADERSSVDLGGRRIIEKKKK